MARGYRNIEKLRKQSADEAPPGGAGGQNDSPPTNAAREVAELGAMEIGGALILKAIKGLLHLA